MIKRAQTTPGLFTAMELERLPTISVGQADDLKIEDYDSFQLNGVKYDGLRVWLSRAQDGVIDVEYLCDGRWNIHIQYSSPTRGARANA
jgi:hypothetical protein